MEPSLTLMILVIGCLKTVILEELLYENDQNVQNLPTVSSLPQDKDGVTDISSESTTSGLSNKDLINIFNTAKNISHSKGIYKIQTNHEEMPADESKLRRSVRRKINILEFSDDVNNILKCIETDENKALLLDDLERLVHEFDVAVNFANLGGIQKISQFLYSTSDDIASSAAMVLGAAVQSNPIVQKIAVKQNLCSNLLNLFPHKSPVVLSRMIFALASLLRNSPEAQEVFIKENGISELSKILKNHVIATNTKLKIINLLNDLVVEQILNELYYDQSSQLTSNLKRLFTRQLKEYDICKFIPSFLYLEDFDSHQKIITAMISLSNICMKDFHNGKVIKRIKKLIGIYNPESNHSTPFYPVIDMELKMLLHKELKTLLKKITIKFVDEDHENQKYTKDEL